MSIKITQFPVLLISFLLCFAVDHAAAQTDTIQHKQTVTLNSTVLKESRLIWVHLPENYDPANKERYPVIYLLDGSMHYHYVSEMADFMASYDVNRMPAAIVVGINHEDRGKDLNIQHARRADGSLDSAVLQESGAPVFLEFIKNELVPYIDRHYKTAPYRILVGHSLAGLFAFYTKLNAPNLFQATILVSPALGGINEQLTNSFKGFLQQHPTLRNKIFITLGNEDSTQVKKLTDILSTSAPKSVQWQYRQYNDENHFSVPYKSIFDALKFIYADWFFDNYSGVKFTAQEITTRFNKLSAVFGYSMYPAESFLNSMGYKQLRSGNIDEAIAIFKENINNHPTSYNVYDSMGEACMKKGDTESAIRYYERSLQLNPDNEDGKEALKKLRGRK